MSSKVRPARVISAQNKWYKVELVTTYEKNGSKLFMNVIDKTKGRLLKQVLRIIFSDPKVLTVIKDAIELYEVKANE
jgi:hypothetical protein